MTTTTITIEDQIARAEGDKAVSAGSVVATLIAWTMSRIAARRRLAVLRGLSDHSLRDIGIDPGEVRQRDLYDANRNHMLEHPARCQ